MSRQLSSRLAPSSAFNLNAVFVNGRVEVEALYPDANYNLKVERVWVMEPTATTNFDGEPVTRNTGGALMSSKYAPAPGSIEEKRAWLSEDVTRHNQKMEKEAYEYRRKLELQEHMHTALKYLHAAQTVKHPFDIYRNITRVVPKFFSKPEKGQPGYLPEDIEDECARELGEHSSRMMDFRFKNPFADFAHLDPGRAPIHTMKFENLPDEVPGAVYKCGLFPEAKVFAPPSPVAQQPVAPPKQLQQPNIAPKPLDVLLSCVAAMKPEEKCEKVAKMLGFCLDGPSSPKNVKSESKVVVKTEKALPEPSGRLASQDEFLAHYFASQKGKGKAPSSSSAQGASSKPASSDVMESTPLQDDSVEETHTIAEISDSVSQTTSKSEACCSSAESISEKSAPSTEADSLNNGRLASQDEFMAALQKKSPSIRTIKTIDPSLSSISSEVKEPVVTKPAEVKHIEIEPVKVNPVEVKPVEIKPVEAKFVEVKPVEVKPVEVATIRTAASKPLATDFSAWMVKTSKGKAKPIEIKSAEVQPVEVQPVEVQPVEVQPVEVQSVEAKSVEVATGASKPLATNFSAWITKAPFKGKTAPPTFPAALSMQLAVTPVTKIPSTVSTTDTVVEDQVNEPSEQRPRSPRINEPTMPATPIARKSSQEAIQIQGPITPLSITNEKPSKSLMAATDFNAWLSKAKPFQSAYITPQSTEKDVSSPPYAAQSKQTSLQNKTSVTACPADIKGKGMEVSKSYEPSSSSSSLSIGVHCSSEYEPEKSVTSMLMWNGAPLDQGEEVPLSAKVAPWVKSSKAPNYTVDIKDPKFLQEGLPVAAYEFMVYEHPETYPFDEETYMVMRMTQTSNLEAAARVKARKERAAAAQLA